MADETRPYDPERPTVSLALALRDAARAGGREELLRKAADLGVGMGDETFGLALRLCLVDAAQNAPARHLARSAMMQEAERLGVSHGDLTVAGRVFWRAGGWRGNVSGA